jgi:Lon protease-like protein
LKAFEEDAIVESRRRPAGSDSLPEVAAIFPLAGALLLPGGRLPLNVFEPRYLDMVDDALASHRFIGMIQPESDVEAEKPSPRLARIGCLGRLTQFAETGDGRYLIVLSGISRFRRLEESVVATRYRQCRMDYAPFSDDADPAAGEERVDRAALLSAFQDYAAAKGLDIEWDNIGSAPTAALVTAFASLGLFGIQEKQALLEAPTVAARADVLITLARFDAAPGDVGRPLQ